jgi:hypothetical protein
VTTTYLKRRKGKLKAKFENILSLGVRNYLKPGTQTLGHLAPGRDSK